MCVSWNDVYFAFNKCDNFRKFIDDCYGFLQFSGHVRIVDSKKVVVLTPINFHNPKSETMDCDMKLDQYSINLGVGTVTNKDLEVIVSQSKAQKFIKNEK